MSISLTAIISVISVVTIPLVVVFSYGQFMGEGIGTDVSVQKMAISVFLVVTIPVLLGLLFRRFAENLAIGFEPLARHVSTALFVLVLRIHLQQKKIV